MAEVNAVTAPRSLVLSQSIISLDLVISLTYVNSIVFVNPIECINLVKLGGIHVEDKGVLCDDVEGMRSPMDPHSLLLCT